ncbi:hypothetical protein B7755_043355 [Streptomyces sp. NBS 14/10]|uniref:hypothetical protein n=1 Tax=Streptomyces sp. NBS 14/10 TaxID=1945643 RepID=UPI0015C65FE1|nr:hypothetical protein [Streptomyces sp. NBS 14/10]KAK1184349.1 hypothetical protein B7755_043355 [Streptomyces sp. NBS 14/10]
MSEDRPDSAALPADRGIPEENTRQPANPLVPPEDTERLDSWNLHQLRHCTLAHDAESGT